MKHPYSNMLIKNTIESLHSLVQPYETNRAKEIRQLLNKLSQHIEQAQKEAHYLLVAAKAVAVEQPNTNTGINVDYLWTRPKSKKLLLKRFLPSIEYNLINEEESGDLFGDPTFVRRNA